jgi:hypothetical protein
MNLDNARALKSSLLSKTVKSLEAPTAIRAMGIRAQAAAAVSKDPMRTVALGIGRSGKQHTLAVRVQRQSLINHPVVEDIKKKAKGEVDVRYVGRVVKLETPATLQKRRRPMVIGCSIGHFAITAGTLGCFVEDKSGARLILSNNHVLANENDAKKGDAIIQPGSIDNGKRPKDVVAKLKKFVALKTGGVNFVDCAVATPVKNIKFDFQTLGSFGQLAGLGPKVVVDGTVVRKVGRTTGETSGRVTAFELDNVVVGNEIGNLRLDDQIEIELIVDENLMAVALLFAGGDTGGSNGMGLTYGNSIHAVLDALKVDLLT